MNNQFNRSFDFPLKQFWCRSFKDSSSCGIHLKVFALFFFSSGSPQFQWRAEKGWQSDVHHHWLLGGCDHGGRLHWRTVLHQSHTPADLLQTAQWVSWLTGWMNENSCSCSVGCGYISCTHQQISSKLCFLNEWLTEWKFIYCVFLQCWLWLHQSHTSADLLQTAHWVSWMNDNLYLGHRTLHSKPCMFL